MTSQLCRRHAGGPEQLAREGIIIMLLTLLTTCMFMLCENGFLCWSISGGYLQVPQTDRLSVVDHCLGTGEGSVNSAADMMRLDTAPASGLQPILPGNVELIDFLPEKDFPVDNHRVLPLAVHSRTLAFMWSTFRSMSLQTRTEVWSPHVPHMAGSNWNVTEKMYGPFTLSESYTPVTP